MIWDAILEVLIYPLAVCGTVFDGLSTYLLLEYTEDSRELNPRTAYFHERFGLARGQALHSVLATLLWVGGIHFVRIYSGLAVASLAVGMYLGFSIKQLYDGYCAYEAAGRKPKERICDYCGGHISEVNQVCTAQDDEYCEAEADL